MRQPKLKGRQARWCMFFIPFNFIIEYYLEKLNPADGFSRQWKNSEKVVFNTELMQPIQQSLVFSLSKLEIYCLRNPSLSVARGLCRDTLSSIPA
jgi:hypothetical protein